MTPEQQAEWEQAQVAERGHWTELWSEDKAERDHLAKHEAVKGDFIFDQLAQHFGIDADKDWADKSVLDVGCGPVSLVARRELGKTRAGVDPLQYPDWVFDDYKKHGFKVYLEPFEEFKNPQRYDVVVMYNALQHFADLQLVAERCQKVLAKGGVVYLAEYLEVPMNEAHIQFLTADRLNRLFGAAGFKVESDVLPVRLEGMVERPDGQPIDLYVAKLS